MWLFTAVIMMTIIGWFLFWQFLFYAFLILMSYMDNKNKKKKKQ